MTTEEQILQLLTTWDTPIDLQVKAFFAGAAFIAPLLVFALVKSFARKAAKAEVLE